jgi:hypothetical protein
MFRLCTEPSSGFFLSLKLHIIYSKSVISLVQFVSTVFHFHYYCCAQSLMFLIRITETGTSTSLIHNQVQHTPQEHTSRNKKQYHASVHTTIILNY